ncbi:MAG: cell division protein FtsZ [Paludibacteraceae bacterium]|nr:cell division protein FtsZ [Paludibacteraceae bacterium]MBQ6766711.1 cell division protein FtsZ [Paludibacteraceae bacterium]MDY6373418.1 cell division protein FtsZ [Bacteroidales bacterium]MDY6427621.1 cell division protein FtsZ [Bacteroidales bacterium]
MLDYALPKEINQIIKVIGVGGGGSNAVNHMYQEGIHNVSFAVCNADIQDLTSSPVPVKIQIGEKLTDGLGCGAKPEIGRAAALESEDAIKELLSDGTKMVFITAGMGGGTGTGAAPVVANIAKELGLLTIGIVTIPFKLELGSRIRKAVQGVTEMSKYVDALLIINNEKLIELYPDMTLDAAFYKADEVLSESAKGIAEMITKKGEIVNVDFADVNTILKDSGVAIMNSGMAEGENRVKEAIEEALSTPLLKNKDIKQATRILMYVYTSSEHKLTMREMGEISRFVNDINKDSEEEMIWGGTYDDNLEKSIKITIIATGFNSENISEITDTGTIYNTYYGENAVKQHNEDRARKRELEAQTEADATADIVTSEEDTEKAASETKEEKKDDMEVIGFEDWADTSDDNFSDFDTPPSLRKK